MNFSGKHSKIAMGERVFFNYNSTHFRANLEFVKGNHRKSTKLLGLGMQNHLQLAGNSGSSDYNASLFHNNLGLINVMLNKPNLGVFYMDKAIEQHRQAFTDNPSSSAHKTFLLR